jgi:phosphoribosylglycinamide formyltransferase-1
MMEVFLPDCQSIRNKQSGQSSLKDEPIVLHIVLLVSGNGTNLQVILDQIADQRLQNVQIVGVIASRENTFAQERARLAGIPTAVVKRSDYDSREAYDQAMLDTLAEISEKPVDLVVLAGFLSLVGPELIRRFNGRIINIHPALIPSFCGPGMYGIHPHEAAIDRGVRITGATVHLIDEDYDHGPIILQKAVAILADDTPQTLQQRVMAEAEQVILPEAIRLFAENRIVIEGRHVRIRKEIQ